MVLGILWINDCLKLIHAIQGLNLTAIIIHGIMGTESSTPIIMVSNIRSPKCSPAE
jgi:hypothetical protein